MINKNSMTFTFYPLVAITAVLASGNLFAAEWAINSGVSTGLTYTDNVNLASSGQESEMITTLSPNINLSGRGARANVDLAASVQFNNLNNATGSYNTQLQANADVELVERLLFVDAKSTISQNAIDPLIVSGSDTLNSAGNTTTTTTFQVSPYIKGRLKSFASYEARYTYNDVANSEVSNGGSSSESLLLAINSGDDFRKVTWGLRGNHKTTEAEQGSSRDSSSLDLTLGYQFSRKWQVNATLGKEWNDTSTTAQDPNGLTWDIGAIWTPSSRTNLDFGIGKRYFGSTKRLSFDHKNRRTVWTASYTHSVTDSHTLLSDQNQFEFTDAFGQPIDPATGNPIPNNQSSAAINDNTFIDKRFATSFTWQGHRTNLTLTGDHSTQTSGTSNETQLMGLGVTVSRNLSGLLSANANINWNESESTGVTNQASETLRLGAGLTQQLGVETSLLLNYTHTESNSDQAGQGYDENRLALTLTHSF